MLLGVTKISPSCEEYHYLLDAYPSKTEVVSCEEGIDLSKYAEKCVGYCAIAPEPNTTYTPAVPKVMFLLVDT